MKIAKLKVIKNAYGVVGALGVDCILCCGGGALIGCGRVAASCGRAFFVIGDKSGDTRGP